AARPGRRRHGESAWPMPPSQELVDQRVRRGAVQALVREPYQAIIVEQDTHAAGRTRSRRRGGTARP
ncbi:MAG TPA: hypothetical protein VHZ03_50780, partial [Trebonia sp.]|nr:hypothetical protein [Trebonia sp.]